MIFFCRLDNLFGSSEKRQKVNIDKNDDCNPVERSTGFLMVYNNTSPNVKKIVAKPIVLCNGGTYATAKY